MRVPTVISKRDKMREMECSKVSLRLDEMRETECFNVSLRLAANVCLAVALAALPLLVALVPANVTARCEILLDRLNNMRPEGDTVLHNRVLELEIYARNTNRGKGLGFVLSGTVISRRTLAQLATALFGVLGPAMVWLIGLGASDSGDGSGAK